MPRILINEKDYTSPGTPGQYANYAVLIAGARGRNYSEDDEIQPDSNGVYEFNSLGDFEKTIGTCARSESENGTGTDIRPHYGNQMAYELLKLGYSIIYAPFDDIDEIMEESFWEIFKDKANYDFRFITHGLLESTETPEFKAAAEKKELLEGALTVLKTIRNDSKIKQEADPTLEMTVLQEAKYAEYIIDPETSKYFQYIETKKSNRATTGETVEYKTYANFEEACMGILGVSSEKLDEENQKITEGTLAEARTAFAALSVGILKAADINNANRLIANLATYNAEDVEKGIMPGRGDCLALIELDENTYNDLTSESRPEVLIIDAINNIGANINDTNGCYCAMTVPSVHYKIEYDELKNEKGEKTGKIRFNNNKKFPGAFHYLACFMSSLRKDFAEWYAAAGYTRGVSSYVIDHTTVKLGEIAINALEPRYIVSQDTDPKFACNVIANFRGSYYLWGNRTCEPLQEGGNGKAGDLIASHFLNIRQLCTTIKKQLYVACRRFTFDPNSDTLWYNFVGAIRPTLETMKADQGVRDYKILKVFTDKKATLKAKIRIIPIEAVEDFDIEVSLEDSFGETAVSFN